MTGIFNIQSPQWLGGANVVNTVTMLGVLYLAWNLYKK